MALMITDPFTLLDTIDPDILDERDLYHDLLYHTAPARRYVRPWRKREKQQSGVSNVVNTKNEFKVNLDVQHFKPEQICVKVADKWLIVEGKHEEKKDEHGFVSRQFQRRYLLPDDVDLTAVNSTVSSDGVLTIAAPKKKAPAAAERTIPVVFTNQPCKQEEKKEEEKMQQ